MADTKRSTMKMRWRGTIAVATSLSGLGLVLAACSLYQSPPFQFDNPYDPNQVTTPQIQQRTIVVDGDSSDWAGIMPMRIDPQGDVENPLEGTTGGDVRALYLAEDDTYLYWRIDLWDGPPSDETTYIVNVNQQTNTSSDGIWLTHDHSRSSGGLNHVDAAGNWLWQEPFTDVSWALGTVVEGRMPRYHLQSLAKPSLSVAAQVYRQDVSNQQSDWSENVDLSEIAAASSSPPPTVSPAQKTITVDGDPSDWGDAEAVLGDPSGDVYGTQAGSVGGSDIKALYLALDGSYLYWRIDLWDSTPNSSINYEMTISSSYKRTELHAGIQNASSYAFHVDFDSDGNQTGTTQLTDVKCAVGTVVEGRMPISYFTAFAHRYVEVHATQWDQNGQVTVEDDLGTYDLKM